MWAVEVSSLGLGLRSLCGGCTDVLDVNGWLHVCVQDSTRKPTWRDPGFYRPYITRLQLAQFLVMLGQSSYDMLVPCDYPRFAVQILFYYMLTLLVLFGNFYVQAYIKGKSRPKPLRKQE